MALSRGRKAAITRQNNAKTLKAMARLQRMIERIPKEVRKSLRQELAKGAEGIVADMKAAAPVDSGDLQDSIDWRFGDEDRIAYSQGAGGNHELSVRISAGNDFVRYAHLVEFGTAPHTNGGMYAGSENPGAPAQPFFYPAIRGNKRKLDRRMNAVIRDAVKKSRNG